MRIQHHGKNTQKKKKDLLSEREKKSLEAFLKRQRAATSRVASAPAFKPVRQGHGQFQPFKIRNVGGWHILIIRHQDLFLDFFQDDQNDLRVHTTFGSHEKMKNATLQAKYEYDDVEVS